MKNLIKILITIALCISPVLYVLEDTHERSSGSYSMIGGNISEEAESFILREFGDADSPQNLADQISQFAFSHFVYDLDATPFPQIADIDRFIYQMNFHGVCFEFSVFTKNVFCVIAENKGWDHTKCYLINGYPKYSELDEIPAHSWNCIIIEDKNGNVTICNYDLTHDLSCYKNRTEPLGLSDFVCVSSQSLAMSAMKDLARSMCPHYSYFQYT